MSQSPVDAITGLYAAFGRGDIPAIVETVAEDIDWRAGTVWSLTSALS